MSEQVATGADRRLRVKQGNLHVMEAVSEEMWKCGLGECHKYVLALVVEWMCSIRLASPTDL